MRVILLADVKKVGRKHDIVDVANGYAQNVLLPKKLALPATPENMKRFQKEKGMAAEKQAFSRSLLEKNIKELDGKKLTMSALANENGTLFKTVHAKDIAGALEKEFGVIIPESSIASGDIKKIGDYAVKLSGGATSSILTVSIA